MDGALCEGSECGGLVCTPLREGAAGELLASYVTRHVTVMAHKSVASCSLSVCGCGV